jgi:ERCC4-related helicase
MVLLDGGRPFELRPYQSACVDLVKTRNILCALPVGSGKTVIAAEVVQRMLSEERERKAVFLAPYGHLALQQFQLLLRLIDRLHTGEDVSAKPDATAAELARWRAGLVVGIEEQRTMPWQRCFAECQLLVMTPALFERALQHACVKISDLALLVIDEVSGMGCMRAK